MKERPILFSAPMVRAILDGTKTMTRRIIKPQPTHFNPAGTPRRVVPNGGPSESICCPYGQPGDRLWVRETWMDCRNIDGAISDSMYRATFGNTPEGGQWRPSIHMPRWASRILLEITDVRVERAQDISEADAISEGVQHSTLNDPRVEYRWLWESINGPDSWAATPWVWVIEFRKIES